MKHEIVCVECGAKKKFKKVKRAVDWLANHSYVCPKIGGKNVEVVVFDNLFSNVLDFDLKRDRDKKSVTITKEQYEHWLNVCREWSALQYELKACYEVQENQ